MRNEAICSLEAHVFSIFSLSDLLSRLAFLFYQNKKSSNKLLNQGYYLHFSSFFEDFTAIYLDFGASHLPKFTFIFTLGFTLFRPKLLILPLRGSLFLFFKNIRFLRNRFQIGNFKFHTHYVPTERFCDYYF